MNTATNVLLAVQCTTYGLLLRRHRGAGTGEWAAFLLLMAAATGAGIGAVTGVLAGILDAVFRRSPPSPAYTGFVDRCLRERGYEPTGWQ